MDIQGDIPGTATTITGLSPLSSHTYAIRAFDADGNVSPNSPLVSFQTLSPPVSFRYAGATTLPANFPLQLQFYANANPTATFSIVSGPAELTLDPDTGLVDWIPTPADVGTQTLVVRATNSGGSVDPTVDLTVNPDAPQLSVQFTPGAGGYSGALSGSPWAAQIFDGSHTPSTFELISAPPGMTIVPATGELSWVPTPDDAGICSVMIRATNAAATADFTFEFYCHFTGAISNPQVTGLTDLHPTATWTAPVGPGADRTAGYTIVATVRYRYGRSYRTHRVTYETDAETPTVSLEGLLAGRTYILYVTPFDESDNRGLTNSPGLPFTPLPGLPNVRWSLDDANGGAGLVAGQELVVSFTEYGTAFGAVSYSPVSVPPGFTLDPVTGEGRWTPGVDDTGAVWHKGVYITPLDADGRAGVSTPLIPYNGALPAGIPPSEPAWIESVTVDPDGTPLVGDQGEVGVVANLEVTNDFSLWDPIDTVTIGDEGVVVCPDLTSQSNTKSFSRLQVP